MFRRYPMKFCRMRCTIAGICLFLFFASSCTIVSAPTVTESHDFSGCSTPFISPPATDAQTTQADQLMHAVASFMPIDTSTSSRLIPDSSAEVVTAPIKTFSVLPHNRIVHKSAIVYFHPGPEENFWYYVGAFFLSLLLCITIPGFPILFLGYVWVYDRQLSKLGEILIVLGLLCLIAELLALVLLIAGSPVWLPLSLILLALGIVSFPFLFSLFVGKR
jgi:hypothetical protein